MKKLITNPQNTILVLWLLMIVPFQLLAQKIPYHSELDTLWSRNSYIKEMSHDGNWALIQETGDYKLPELRLIHITDSVHFNLKNAQVTAFSPNSKWLFYLNAHSELNLFDLEKHQSENLGKSTKSEFSSSGNLLAYLNNIDSTQNLLTLLDLKRRNSESFTGIIEFVWHPQKDRIIAVRKKSSQMELLSIEFSGKYKILEECEDCAFSHLQYNETGTSLAFLVKKDQNSELHIMDDEGKKYTINDTEVSRAFPDYVLSSRNPEISTDGKIVFFYREKENLQKDHEEKVEVWKTDDVWIYPRQQTYDHSKRQLLTMLNIEKSELRVIEDETLSSSKASPDRSLALVYDIRKYEPQYEHLPYADYFLLDLNTGLKKRILEKQYTDLSHISISPSGKYISYFKDLNWWLYDVSKDRHLNLTQDLHQVWINKYHVSIKNPAVIQKPMWSVNEKYILLHDEYDIWKISIENNHAERLTKGKEKEITYSIFFEKNDRNYIKKAINSIGLTYDLNSPIILQMNGKDLQTGLALWEPGSGVRHLFYGQTAVGMVKQLDKNAFVFGTHRFNDSPSFYRYDLNSGKAKRFYESNPNLKNYDLGKYEIFNYAVNGSEKMNGLLIYPAQYDASKKYPMIVWVYERNSVVVNKFLPPSARDPINFNIYKFITNGYFVLLPDILYEVGNPGFSALNSVAASVEKAMRTNPSIDVGNLGLIGHSFGGYESAFIATQTPLFKAVVAGAAMTEMVSFYHDIVWEWQTNQAWRMESQQFRMGKSFYNFKENYYLNSPLYHVEKLQTPLLLWTGKNDTNINWYQGIFMYSAMKRLKKEGKLILFNDDDHSLMKKENMERLSSEIFDWFEYYLK